MRALIHKYSVLVFLLAVLVGYSLFDQVFTSSVIDLALVQLKELLLVVPPVFILLGLLDVWVPKATLSRWMGTGSGMTGGLLAFLVGSAAAGPLYGAFPVASVFMKKGVSFTNVLIFIGAWSTTKLPMLLFEISSLGPRFALTRLLIDIPGIIIIAVLLNRIIPEAEKVDMYQRAEKR
ncbi:MAG: permease [Sphaerochaetaceae bacterium]|nr:permease [Sphaerochaetaceae bacterium]